MNNHSGLRAHSKKYGFTLIELLVVIAIIAILASILFPVFSRARENARRSNCLSNLKQVGMGLMQYSNDFDERLIPPYLDGSGYWLQKVQPYVKSYQIFICPSDSYRYVGSKDIKLGAYLSYGLNMRTDANSRAGGNPPYNSPGIYVASIRHPSELLMTVDNKLTTTDHGWFAAWHTPAGGGYHRSNYAPPIGRHFEGASVGFADGHAKWMNLTNLTTVPADANNWRLWEPEAN